MASLLPALLGLLLLGLAQAAGDEVDPSPEAPLSEELIAALDELDDSGTSPVARRALESRLAEAPPSVALDRSLRRLLAASGPVDTRSFATRQSVLKVLASRQDPEATDDLLTIWVRSRMGELPEDPDLFERALDAVRTRPPEEVRAALGPGMAVAMRDLALHRLQQRWWSPATRGLDPQVAQALRLWPQEQPDEWEMLALDLGGRLEQAFEAHGMALVDAFRTEGGSVGLSQVDQLESRLLAALLPHEDQRVARVAADLARDRGLAHPALIEALRTRSRRPGAGTEAAEAAEAALLSLGDPVVQRPIAPPSAEPGQVPDLEPAVPTEVAQGAVSPFGPGRLPLHDALPWVGLASAMALVGLLLGLGVGRRWRPLSHLGAVVLGLAALPLSEGLLLAGGVVPLARTRPLFSFNDWKVEVVLPLEGRGPAWRSSGPGSVRYQEFLVEPPEDTLRIAVVGASSAHGSNHLSEETLSAGIERRLRGGTRPVEVLNFAIGGTISTGVLYAAQQAMDVGAEALVVYYGHNEVVQFTRLALYRQTSADRVRTRMWLARSALYTTVAAPLLKLEVAGALMPLEGVELAEEEPDRAAIEELKALAHAHHRSNLDQLLRLAAEREVEVVLVDPPTNWRFTQLQPMPDQGPGDAADLEVRLAQARSDSLEGRHSSARQAWQGAIDACASPRVATTGIRGNIAALAREHGNALVDANALFYADSPDGLTANGLFWDDLHPTVAGLDLLAEAVAPLLEPLVEGHPVDRGP